MGIGIARYVGLSKADARTVRPYMPLATNHFLIELILKFKIQCSMFKVKNLKGQSSKFNVQTSMSANHKVQCSILNVQNQSPYMPMLAGTDLKHLLGNVYSHL